MRKSGCRGVLYSMTANHIGLVFHDFSTGGSERIAIRLANAWAEAGRRVTIFCGSEAGTARDLVSDEVDVIACAPEIRRGPGSRLRLGRSLGRTIGPHMPDVIFAPGNFHLLVLAVAARTRGWSCPPLVCKLSNPLLPISRFGVLARVAGFFIRWLIAPVDRLTAMSPDLAYEAFPVLRRDDLSFIDEPILTSAMNTLTCAGDHSGTPIILCIGRLERQKDFALAIRAFAALPSTSSATLVILGEGPDRAALLTLAQRLKVADRVEMPGHVPDVGLWLAKARVLLMTSRYEGFPAVLIEARAWGVPVITTNCSAALRDILPLSIHGEIVQSRRPEAIGAAIRAQLDRPGPEPETIQAGTERYRIERIAPEYLRLFDAVAA